MLWRKEYSLNAVRRPINQRTLFLSGQWCQRKVVVPTLVGEYRYHFTSTLETPESHKTHFELFS